MIKSIELKNFRSWQSIQIALHPGVNVIAGENDSGKTNLLRAINWVVNNRPTGEDVRSNWCGPKDITASTIEFNDCIVKRIRSSTENLYRLQTNGTTETFKAFGAGVPEPIQSAVNFSGLNIAFQLDGPFLLGKSSADTARHFNDLVHLDIIDKTIAGIKAILRAQESQLKIAKSVRDQHQESYDDLSWLDEAEPLLISLEKLQADIFSSTRALETLMVAARDLNSLDNKMDQIQQIVRHEKTTLRLFEQERMIAQLDLEIGDLCALAEDFEKCDARINSLEGYFIRHERNVVRLLNQFTYADKKRNDVETLAKAYGDGMACSLSVDAADRIVSLGPAVDKLVALSAKTEKLQNEYNDLANIIEQIERLDDLNAHTANELIDLQNEFVEVAPNLCPVLDIPCKELTRIKRHGC